MDSGTEDSMDEVEGFDDFEDELLGGDYDPGGSETEDDIGAQVALDQDLLDRAAMREEFSDSGTESGDYF